MKNALIILVALFVVFSAKAQNYGNEWIDYGQKHLKIKIVADGLYRLDSAQLAPAVNALGLSFSTLDPQDFRMFGRGEELAIRVQGEGDGSFDGGDYIEFIARANDGWLDTLVYDDPEHVSNPYFSLYQDTAAYFITLTTSAGVTPRRMVEETDVNFSAWPTADWFWTTRHDEGHTWYFYGFQSLELSASEVTAGEGWFDGLFTATGTPINYNIPTPNVFLGGPSASVVATAASLNDPPEASGMFVNHHLKVAYNSNNMPSEVPIFNQQYSGYDFNRHAFSITNAELGTSSTTIGFTAYPIANGTSYHSVGHVTLTYPHTFDMEGQTRYEMAVPHQSGTTKSVLEFSNFGGTTPMLYDESLGKRIPVLLDNGLYKAVLPNNGGGNINCLLIDEGQVQAVSSNAIEVVNADGFFNNFSNVSLDSAYIIITHESLWNSALAYASYRDLSGHQTLVVDVEELYNQFAYGIRKHPSGLREFMRFAVDNFPTRPGHLFLIGKAVRAAGTYSLTSGSRISSSNYQNNLVPSYGYPCSDALITYNLEGDLTTTVPVGRLAALTTTQVDEYLDKVQDFETAQLTPEPWMKRILHFGGGSDTVEQNRFRGYLAVYEETVEDTCWGANVYEFLKTTSAPIQINISDSVTDLINDGVSIMTFFGHASGDGFDVALDEPASYLNENRYPLLIGNSCYTGGIHEPGISSTSEDFVLIPNKGVIGFLASVNVGLDLYLHYYTEKLYERFTYQSYGRTLGQCMKGAIQDYLTQFGTLNMFARATAHTMTLHGDPALVMNTFPTPDFEIDVTDVYFNPGLVTADIDSFDLNVVVSNLGKATYEPFSISIDHHYPNGADSTYEIQAPGVLYIDTFSIRLPVDPVSNLGVNNFDVHVDIPTFVDEIDDFGNNEVFGSNLLVVNTGIIPVVPLNYAIVPDSVIPLKASTGNPYAESRDYIFEIDTTDLFNSPFKISQILTASGGVVEWQPIDQNGDTLVMTDSTVYYWRVTGDSVWRESSYQYIRNRKGWGQAHHFQFEDNEYNVVEYNRQPREYTFQPRSVQLDAQVIGNPNSNSYTEVQFSLNLSTQMAGGCGLAPALHVVVIDSLDLTAWGTYGYPIGQPNCQDTSTWINSQHRYGNINDGATCLCREEQYFNFRQAVPAEMQSLENMINAVPDGNFIMVYSWFYVNYDGWDAGNANLYNVFQNLGSTNIFQGAQDSIPFIFFAKKGDPNSAVEVFGTHIGDTITLSENLYANYTFGTVTSELAGPASDWSKLYWDQHSKENPTTDSTVIRLFGVAGNGASTLVGSWDVSQDSVTNLSSILDANLYPYARIEAYTSDGVDVTPTQLERWQLLYKPAPEAALNASAGHYFYGDSVQEGEKLEFAIAIENIGSEDMDSMLVHYWVEDSERSSTYLDYERQAPLPVGAVLYDTVQFNTAGFPGLNYLWVEANPINPSTNEYDQLEQAHFNNIAVRSFKVGEDKINPILDVTFDGIHIMNGELVSASPYVLVTLDDENPYLIMNEETDTAFFRVFLTSPDGNQWPVRFRNSLNEEIIVFNPAGSDNKSSLEYHPQDLADGVYELLIRANDKSGNSSGDVEYRVEFEVINRLTVSEVLNYPNPFTTSTRFVFTITGEEPPPYFMIRIMTITGRVVREIHEDELGQLRIGRNMTEYAWDGTDDFGDRLANGVYLYQVIVKDENRQNVERRNTEASKFFTKGLGKMYLMR